MSDILEIKKIIEAQGQAWEEFKLANDELIKAKADGKAVSDLEAKLTAISTSLDNLGALKSEFDSTLAKLQRPGGVENNADTMTECKNFNAMLRADLQSKGRPAVDLGAEDYAHYKSGFFKVLRHGNLELLSAEERKAMSVGSDPDGGYLLPPATVGRMVTRIFERSPMRQLATVQTISTDALEGVADNDEADAGWVSEMGARNDTDTPQVGRYRIEANEMYAQPKVTQKLIDDAATDVEAWLANKIADKFARVESAGFITGNGAGQPRGLTTYTTAATGDDTRAWGQFEHVKTGANGAFASSNPADVLFDLIGAFRPAYLQRASWLVRREAITAIRKFKDGQGQYLWQPALQAGQPERLSGYPVFVDQYMPALATNSLSVAFGDFAEGYTIVDRIGVRTLRDPFTSKPYIRFYSTRRVGGGAVNFEAVKFLKFAA